jgi:hypothetical protein
MDLNIKEEVINALEGVEYVFFVAHPVCSKEFPEYN